MEPGRHQARGSTVTFDIHGCLGRGGFGEVYHATMTTASGVRRDVAIKTLRADIDPGSDAVLRLRDEGRLLGAVRHPAIVRMHDLVLLDGRVALVTEYVDGQDLLALTGDGLPPRLLVDIVGEVASALDIAWRSPAPGGDRPLHLVHRDVKPANIRIGRHGEVKLLDFGIARANLDSREAHTQTNVAMGSIMYMAPERFRTDHVEPPSDVFSLGCTLYYGLLGRTTFGDVSPQVVWRTMLAPQKASQHLSQVTADVPASVPAPVRALLARMLHPEPSARPTAAEVARLCEDLDEELAGPSLRRWCQERTWPNVDHVRGAIAPGRIDLPTFEGPAPAAEPAAPPKARLYDGDATFGLADLSEEEFDREIRRRRWRSRLLGALLLVVALGAAAGAAAWRWPYPFQMP